MKWEMLCHDFKTAIKTIETLGGIEIHPQSNIQLELTTQGLMCSILDVSEWMIYRIVDIKVESMGFCFVSLQDLQKISQVWAQKRRNLKMTITMTEGHLEFCLEDGENIQIPIQSHTRWEYKIAKMEHWLGNLPTKSLLEVITTLMRTIEKKEDIFGVMNDTIWKATSQMQWEWYSSDGVARTQILLKQEVKQPFRFGIPMEKLNRLKKLLKEFKVSEYQLFWQNNQLILKNNQLIMAFNGIDQPPLSYETWTVSNVKWHSLNEVQVMNTMQCALKHLKQQKPRATIKDVCLQIASSSQEYLTQIWDGSDKTQPYIKANLVKQMIEDANGLGEWWIGFNTQLPALISFKYQRDGYELERSVFQMMHVEPKSVES